MTGPSIFVSPPGLLPPSHSRTLARTSSAVGTCWHETRARGRSLHAGCSLPELLPEHACSQKWPGANPWLTAHTCALVKETLNVSIEILHNRMNELQIVDERYGESGKPKLESMRHKKKPSDSTSTGPSSSSAFTSPDDEAATSWHCT